MDIELRNEIFRQLTYSPDNRWFMWLKDGNYGSMRNRAGRKAGRASYNGYIVIPLAGYRDPLWAHRLAFVFMTRDWPKGVVDHINQIKTDNRWENLRDTDMVENSRNSSKLRESNKSGYRGVSWFARDSKWMAYINIRGKMTYLGYFDTAEEAAKARRTAEEKYWNGNRGLFS